MYIPREAWYEYLILLEILVPDVIRYISLLMFEKKYKLVTNGPNKAYLNIGPNDIHSLWVNEYHKGKKLTTINMIKQVRGVSSDYQLHQLMPFINHISSKFWAVRILIRNPLVERRASCMYESIVVDVSVNYKTEAEIIDRLQLEKTNEIVFFIGTAEELDQITDIKQPDLWYLEVF